jgi:hypothetical protein
MTITTILVILFVIAVWLKPRKNKTIDLTQPVQLRFVKTDYSEYEIQFFNPYKNSWWAIPSGRAGIHAPWSFQSKGSYGAYSLQTLKCKHYQIDSYKKSYRTLNDIQKIFDSMNKQYQEFMEVKRKEKELPNTIY